MTKNCFLIVFICCIFSTAFSQNSPTTVPPTSSVTSPNRTSLAPTTGSTSHNTTSSTTQTTSHTTQNTTQSTQNTTQQSTTQSTQNTTQNTTHSTTQPAQNTTRHSTQSHNGSTTSPVTPSETVEVVTIMINGVAFTIDFTAIVIKTVVLNMTETFDAFITAHAEISLVGSFENFQVTLTGSVQVVGFIDVAICDKSIVGIGGCNETAMPPSNSSGGSSCKWVVITTADNFFEAPTLVDGSLSGEQVNHSCTNKSLSSEERANCICADFFQNNSQVIGATTNHRALLSYNPRTWLNVCESKNPKFQRFAWIDAKSLFAKDFNCSQSGTICNVQKQVIANEYEDCFNYLLANPISSANGTVMKALPTWTATGIYGGGQADNCEVWSSADSASRAQQGDPYLETIGWLQNRVGACSEKAGLYCFAELV